MPKAKSEKRQRTELFLGIRWYPFEKDKIVRRAENAGVSAGEYLRRCALEREVTQRADVDLMMELLRLGKEQKYIMSQLGNNGSLDEELRQKLCSVLTGIERVFLQFAKETGAMKA